MSSSNEDSQSYNNDLVKTVSNMLLNLKQDYQDIDISCYLKLPKIKDAIIDKKIKHENE